MIKRGLCTAEQFEAYREQGRLLERPISCGLLRLPEPPSASDIRRFEEISRLLMLPGNVFRTTYRRRFANFDPWTVDVLARLLPVDQPLVAYDWGASNCLTSAEWAECLLERFRQARLIASDLSLDLVECWRDGTAGAWIFDTDGVLVQYVRPPVVIPLLWEDSPLFAVNHFWRWWAPRVARELRWNELPATWLHTEGDTGEIRQGRWRLRKLPLSHPEARALTRPSGRFPGRFRIERHSVFDAAPEPGQVVRTMNILNRQYFSEERLRDGVRAVWASLTEGGLWIVGRTMIVQESGQVGETEASLLRKRAAGFELVERRGAGSEIEQTGLRLGQS